MLDTDVSFVGGATSPYEACACAHPDADALSAWALEGHDDPLRARMTELLAGVSPADVPRLAAEVDDQADDALSAQEAFVLASIDGASTLERLVDTIVLPAGEALEIVCRLCARGIVTLDRMSRSDEPGRAFQREPDMGDRWTPA